MGLNLGVNILTSGFLVTVLIFLVVMGVLFVTAASKIQEVLIDGDSRTNNQQELKSAYNSVRVAYILAFIAAALALLLAILYAGHETVINPSEYWHLALFLITYILLVISVIYAYVALDKIYDLRIADRNGADAYIWAGMLMAIFGFVGLTASGTGRLGMNIMRTGASKRLSAAETKVNEHLPAIRAQVDENLQAVRNEVDEHLPAVRAKVDQLAPVVVASPGLVSPSSGLAVPTAASPSFVVPSRSATRIPTRIPTGRPQDVFMSPSALQTGLMNV